MRKLLLASCFGVAALFTVGYATANDELAKLSADPNQWVMPGGELRQLRGIQNSSRSTPRMSTSSRRPGLSRPAFCADTKARRS